MTRRIRVFVESIGFFDCNKHDVELFWTPMACDTYFESVRQGMIHAFKRKIIHWKNVLDNEVWQALGTRSSLVNSCLLNQ